jgi:hypothetical protein
MNADQLAAARAASQIAVELLREPLGDDDAALLRDVLVALMNGIQHPGNTRACFTAAASRLSTWVAKP